MSGDKSLGQWVGAIIGGVIGFFNPALGWAAGMAIGGAIGGLIDPPKGPTINGPRLQDLSVQTSTFGAPIPRIYGTVAVAGNVIWLENNQLREVVRKKKTGGKGGDGATVRTYHYYATFAVALTEAPPTGIVGVRRVWVGSELIFNSDTMDLGTIIASNRTTIPSGGKLKPEASLSPLGQAFKRAKGLFQQFVIYPGTDDQLPDYRIEADMGVGNAPAFRGLCYIVFYDLPLEKWGNSLMGAQVKVELYTDSISTEAELLSSVTIIDDATGNFQPVAWHLRADKAVVWRPQWGNSYPSSSSMRQTIVGLSGKREGIPYAITGGTSIPAVGWSDDESMIFPDGYFPGTSELFGSASGRFVYRNHVLYGVAWSSQRIYRRDPTTLSWAYVGLTNVKAITADNDGNVYALADDGIYKYDEDLNLVDSLTHTFGETYQERQAFIHWDAGVLYVAFTQYATHWYAVSDDFSYISDRFELPDHPSGLFGDTVISVDSGVITRFAVLDTDTAVVERFRLPWGAPASPALSDVVEAELLRSGLLDPADLDLSELALDRVRGYRPAGIQQIRAVLAPLQAAYPFDIIMSGYQIKAVRRGNGSVMTIPVEHLDARPYGDAAGVALEQSREMDSQLPRQLLLRHLDPAREYDVNEQRSAERMSTQAVDVREVELALAMTPDEAAQVVDILFNVAWLERSSFSFKLPPPYLALEPADVVTIDAGNAQYEVRLMEINYTPDGRLECTARPNAAASYSSVAVGGEGVIPDGTVGLPGEVAMQLLDVPVIVNDQNEPGFLAAMSGIDGRWQGGVLLRSTDTEQTWTDVQAWTAPVTMGTARTPLGSDDGYVIDRASELIVDLYDGELESITEAQMLTGRNWLAYGADGRWEIMQFANADLQADGSYKLSTLLRGLRGTEWATGLHQYGDSIVLLDDPDVAFIGAELSLLGVPLKWRGAGVGQSIDDVASIDFAYQGVNLRPLSPVHPEMSQAGTDLLISWTPRTRLTGSLWTTGVELPMGEAAEAYEVDILDGGTVKRTLTSSSPSVTYTSAQQIADWGAEQTTIDVAIYQISATVGRGYPCYATLSAGAMRTVLLMEFEGSDGSTSFIDSSSSAHAFTRSGSATISTDTAAVGSSSGKFPGSSYITTPASPDFDFAPTDDFMIRCYVRRISAVSATDVFISRQVDTPVSMALQCRFNSSGRFEVVLRDAGGGTATTYTCTTATATGVWYKFELSRIGGVISVKINDVEEATGASSHNLSHPSKGLYIGCLYGNSASSYINGYVDQLEIRRS